VLKREPDSQPRRPGRWVPFPRRARSRWPVAAHRRSPGPAGSPRLATRPQPHCGTGEV